MIMEKLIYKGALRGTKRLQVVIPLTLLGIVLTVEAWDGSSCTSGIRLTESATLLVLGLSNRFTAFFLSDL